MNFIITHVTQICATLGTLGSLLAIAKWLYSVAIKIDSTFTYIEALRTNHFPHLEHAIREICKRLEIDYEDVEG